ncbi:lipocalin-like domain-containing protein [Bradyrhizobium sp.]|uniref:lipocalin-like domain-containing protein n=1 Tax=Bradyrhizobium sp. TaxID=376 RepID=UPI0009FC0382
MLGQQKPAKEAVLGAWTLVSVTSEMDDGKKGEPFGPSPKGVIIFSSDGYFLAVSIASGHPEDSGE